MIDKRKDCLMFQEQLDHDFWFDKKEKKFLHNIDTFYYSVKLMQDFSSSSDDKNVHALRDFIKNNTLEVGQFCPLVVKGCEDVQLNILPFHFGGFYNFCIECPEMFDIFIASSVPNNESGESVTSEIIVQLRSYILWQMGVTKAFEYSYRVLTAFLESFHLDIMEVKENRADYCWHSNYIQNPETFFRIDKFSKMQVSRFRRIHYEYQFTLNDEYENDYICLGKRSDKCFVRIYLKSKEVVEKGYKPWFFKEWLFNGLISRFDMYVYEKCFVKKKWKYVDTARLEFYLEYGSNENIKSECAAIVNGELEKSDEYIHALADQLTPRLTLITNVEYQTTRRMSKSFCLIPLKDNASKYGVASRIYDYLDNHTLITEYLTHSTLRLVERSLGSNKSRDDYCPFWKALRSTKYVDVSKSPKNLKLVRDYTRKLNKEIVKKRFTSACITYGLYVKGVNSDHPLTDCADALMRLNDNDVFDMKRYKDKKLKLLNNELLSNALGGDSMIHNLTLINNSTGEAYGS